MHSLHIGLSGALQFADTTFKTYILGDIGPTSCWTCQHHPCGCYTTQLKQVVQHLPFSLRMYRVHSPTGSFPIKLDIIKTLLLSYHDVTTTDLSLFTFCAEEPLPLFFNSLSLGKGHFLDLLAFNVAKAQKPLLVKYSISSGLEKKLSKKGLCLSSSSFSISTRQQIHSRP